MGCSEPGAAGVSDPAQYRVSHGGKDSLSGELYPEEPLYGGSYRLSAGSI